MNFCGKRQLFDQKTYRFFAMRCGDARSCLRFSCENKNKFINLWCLVAAVPQDGHIS